jgi:ribosome-binding factor A
MKKESRRSQRVADLVRAELSTLVLIEAHDPVLHRVTITDVEMPPDLKTARVYFSCLGGEEDRKEAGEALRRAAGFLRGEVGRRCQLRHAPSLSFV